jgi:hypothetical protein
VRPLLVGRTAGDWDVMRFVGPHWLETSTDFLVQDRDLAMIGPRVLPPDTATVYVTGREPITVPAAIAARLVEEEILVRDGDELVVSPVMHRDSVLAVLLALDTPASREAIVI